MTKETCQYCEKEVSVVRGNYQFKEVGLPVILWGIELVKCDNCGTIEPIIPNVNGLMDAIAYAVISDKCKLTGAEIKFLRKYLGMSAAEFSRLIHVDPATMSRYENGLQNPSRQTDSLIRLTVLNKSKDLRIHIEEMMTILATISHCDPPARRQLKIDPKTLEYEYA
jgi:putative zinc finger/helix-turn-helix YgiT family protein